MNNEKHYPEEWGPSSNRRLTCSCGDPDPAHMDRYCTDCTGQSLDESEEECRCPMCPQARTVGKCPGAVVHRGSHWTAYEPACGECPRFEPKEAE